MSIDIDYFKKVNNRYGFTRKEKYLNDYHRIYDNNFDKTVDFNIGLLNGIATEMLIIDKENYPTFKYIKTKSNQKLYIGDVVYPYGVENDCFLITNVDTNSEKINQGELTVTNWNIKWIGLNHDTKMKEIKSYPCIIGNATQYNSGEFDGRLAVIGSSQFEVRLPCTVDTISIVRGQRFLIGKNEEEPIAYKVSSLDQVTYNHKDKGLIRLMLEEDVLDMQKDDRELMICNYWIDKEKNISVIDELPDSNTSDSSVVDIIAKIESTCKGEILIGYSEIFEVIFSDKEGNVREIDDFEWCVNWLDLPNVNKYIKVEKTDKLKITIDDNFNYDLLPFLMRIDIKYLNNIVSTYTLTVRGLFG